jgi:hypothetical protein
VQQRVRVLRELVRSSLYVVDEHAVARAIVARAEARDAVAGAVFHSDLRRPATRSSRRDRAARSARMNARGRLPHSSS